MAQRAGEQISPASLNEATSEDTPDARLTGFLRSGDVVAPSSQKQTAQEMLREILLDKRWDRRMLEDWYKKGPPSKTFTITPNPEFRALYLVLLSILEDQGKETPRSESIGESTTAAKGKTDKKEALTQEEMREEQRRLDKRILEHFNPDAGWEQV